MDELMSYLNVLFPEPGLSDSTMKELSQLHSMGIPSHLLSMVQTILYQLPEAKIEYDQFGAIKLTHHNIRCGIWRDGFLLERNFEGIYKTKWISCQEMNTVKEQFDVLMNE